MGNQQSAEEGAVLRKQKQPTKLTKPRTNTSTTNLLANASRNASRRNSTVELPTVFNKRASTIISEPVDIPERPKTSKPETKQKRRSLFRSKSAQSTQREEEVVDIREKELQAWASPLNRYSTLGSVTYETLGDVHITNGETRPPLRTTRSASVRPYSHQVSRLSEIIEVRSPSPERVEGTKQLGADIPEEMDAMSAVSSHHPTERSNSDNSMPIPIRRRSLQTPGIATRGSSRDDPYRQSLPAHFFAESFAQIPARKPLPIQGHPSEDEIQQYYYDPSKPTESPLEELAALETRRLSLMQPRTHTPNEMDYGHIGSFKLGSLRITNGACSPTPSNLETKDEDYLTCSEGHKSEENPYRKTYDPDTLKNFMADTKVEDLPKPKIPASRDRAESPLRQRQDASNTPEKTVKTTIQLPNLSLKPFSLKENNTTNQTHNRNKSQEMAQAYIQEIASSPFSFDDSPPPSPRVVESRLSQLEPTSKHMASEDQLFEDELDSAVSLTTKISRPELLLASTPDKANMSNFELLNTAESRGRTKTVQGPREKATKPLTKTDSGYNSNASLKSLRNRRSWNEGVLADMNAPGLPEKIPPPTPPKAASKRHSYMSLPSQRGQMAEDQPPPTPPREESRSSYVLTSVSSPTKLSQPQQIGELPSKDELPRPPFREPPPVPLKHSSTAGSGQAPTPPEKSPEQNWAAAESRPHVLVIPKAQMPNYLHRRSMPMRMNTEEIFQRYTLPKQLPQSEPGVVSPAQPRPVNKLQSRRSYDHSQHTHVPITVQGSSDVHGREIPPVPQAASAKLDERTKQFPMLMHTYKTVSRTNSKETLATILSMASQEQQAEEIHRYDSLARIYENLPPGRRTNPNIERSRSRGRTPNVLKQSQPIDIMPHHISRRQSADNFSRSSSRSRAPPSPMAYQDAFEAEITSFGSVATSLGASPYDVAISASVPNSRSSSLHRTPSITTSPYSLGELSRQGRPENRHSIGMDSPSAAHFARERSRQRSLSRRTSWDRPVTRDPSLERDSPPVPILDPNEMAQYFNRPMPPSVESRNATAVRIKKTKSPPPVSLRPSPSRSPPPPPAWSSLSAAARDAMCAVRDSPPTSPITSKLAPKSIPNRNKQQEDRWEAQRHAWAARRANASQENGRRHSTDAEIARAEERPCQNQLLHPSRARSQPRRPQSCAPLPSQSNYTQHNAPTFSTGHSGRSHTMTTTTTTVSSFPMRPSRGSIKARNSFDTISSAHSSRVASSTYSDSVYSNAGLAQPQRMKSLTRTQSYGMLADRSTNGNARINLNDYSNPNWRENLQDQASSSGGYHGASQGPGVQRWDEYTSYIGGRHSTSTHYTQPVTTMTSTSTRPSSSKRGTTMTVTTSSRPGTTTVTTSTRPGVSSTVSASAITVDRYNGGFGYGFEPGRGIQGSAGTRGIESDASRKGVEGRLKYGVDLGDVPVILGVRV